MLPTVCGVRDEAGECTFAGIEAESSANCIMPLNSVIDRLKALKVGDRAGDGWLYIVASWPWMEFGAKTKHGRGVQPGLSCMEAFRSLARPRGGRG